MSGDRSAQPGWIVLVLPDSVSASIDSDGPMKPSRSALRATVSSALFTADRMPVSRRCAA